MYETPMPQVRVETEYHPAGRREYFLRVMPLKGVWLTFKKDGKGKTWVQVDLSTPLPLSLFLNLFQGGNADDWHTFSATISHHPPSVQLGKDRFESYFLNEQTYQLSDVVRNQLNHIVHSNQTSEVKSTNQLLTNEDIVAIHTYLESVETN